MKVFICWSGTWGKDAANQIKGWLCRDVLPGVLHDVDVLVSGDITKGEVWFEQLTGFLGEASAALVCLTRDALRSRWVHYEVGAVAKALSGGAAPTAGEKRRAAVFTLLLGVNAGEVDGPLASFQSTSLQDSTDTRRLIADLLRLVGSGPAATDRDQTLSEHWPIVWQSLQDRLAQIPKPFLTDVFPEFDGLFRRKTFQEPIFECVNQKWLERYDGACATLKDLREREAQIEQVCRPHVADMYKALIATVDEYAMAVSMLVGSKTFPIDPSGRVEMDPMGVGEACALRRKRIKSLVARLTDPLQAARFEEAFRFEVAESPAEKKSFIQRRVKDIESEAKTLLDAANDQWRSSDWDYDRIIYSLCLERCIRSAAASASADLANLLGSTLERANMDLERAQVREGMYPPPDCCHLMTLSSALAPLDCAPSRTAFARTDEVRYLFCATKELLDRGRKTRLTQNDPAAIAMWGSFETVMAHSLARIAQVFGLESTDGAGSE
jgi:hypothetical protein